MNAPSISGAHYGAMPDEWVHLDLVLGLTEDLLPVASDITRPVAPTSKLRQVGKVPSRYNAQREVVGIADWTAKRSTDANIEAWSRDPDLGVCVQTRAVRALDVDIDDGASSQALRDFVCDYLGVTLPTRTRTNSGKLLMAFRLVGNVAKRSFHCAGGLVEFLANGQQFVAIGTHPSGARYEWAGGLPHVIPELQPEQFEALWSALVSRFAVAPAAAPRELVTRSEARIAPTVADPMVEYLRSTGRALSVDQAGRVAVACPWKAEHSGDSGESETVWLPAGTGGMDRGHFKCLHAHCAGRADAEFAEAVGFTAAEHARIAADFDVIEAPTDEGRDVFSYVDFGSLAVRSPRPRSFVVQQLLPRKTLTLLSGAGGTGKSLLAQQLAGCVAAGLPFIGLQTVAGPVLGMFGEDDDDELLRRAERLFAAHELAPLTVAPRLYLDGRAGKVNTIATVDRKGVVRPTPIFESLREACAATRPVLVVLDNVAQLFTGEGISRPETTQFCNLLSGLARDFDCAVLLLGHTAKADGSEYAGSTAWDAAVRSRLYFARQDDGTSLLKLVKANYAALGSWRVEYQHGVFVQAPFGAAIAADSLQKARTRIVDALQTFTSRQISTSHGPAARNNLVRLMEEAGMLDDIKPAVAAAALADMLDSKQVLPNQPLGWKNAGRHAVTGLRLATSAQETARSADA